MATKGHRNPQRGVAMLLLYGFVTYAAVRLGSAETNALDPDAPSAPRGELDHTSAPATAIPSFADAPPKRPSRIEVVKSEPYRAPIEATADKPATSPERGLRSPEARKEQFMRAIAGALEIPLSDLAGVLTDDLRFSVFKASVAKSYSEFNQRGGELQDLVRACTQEKISRGDYVLTEDAGPPPCASPWTESVVVEAGYDDDGVFRRKVVRVRLGDFPNYDAARTALTDAVQSLRVDVMDALHVAASR